MSSATQSAEVTLPELSIAPPKGWHDLNLAELWHSRELLYFFVWKDIKIRYKQTVIGAAWAILQPLLTMLIFTLFFGRLAKIPSDGLPYPLFYYCALLPWLYFSTSLQNATNVIVEQQRVITKVYFPRLVLPLSAVTSPLLDFGFGFSILIPMMIHYRVHPTPDVAGIAIISRSRRSYRSWRRTFFIGYERHIPRCSVCRSVPSPVLDVRFSGCLSQQFSSSCAGVGSTG